MRERVQQRRYTNSNFIGKIVIKYELRAVLIYVLCCGLRATMECTESLTKKGNYLSTRAACVEVSFFIRNMKCRTENRISQV